MARNSSAPCWFQDVCEHLGLINLGNKDPGITLVLDSLVSAHQSLQELRATVKRLNAWTRKLDKQ